MKFSERWLRSLVDPPLDTAALCDRLTMIGLEVEESAPAAPPFSNVVVGRIERVSPHPNADRLRVCTVDVGSGSMLQIVCGAPNAAAGMKAPCALPGAKLPEGLEIGKTAVRGVESHGMLCSPKELGIDDDATGLLVLQSDAPIGRNVRDVLSLDDTLITLKLTPNRADCLCLLGVAREVAAATGAELRPPIVTHAPVTAGKTRRVRVEDTIACPRFVSRTIEGIDPGAPTPPWMKDRLERSGVRSISAVVDVTNYVMLELGQPLHAYDDRLLEGAIAVRFARQGETLTLLNGQVIALEPDLLLVCDEVKPLGLAGIMGGEHSGISASTTTVFLEGAFWNPEIIQGKSRRLGFASDAGYRFERGVDFGGCANAVERATELIIALCGGHAAPLDDTRGNLPRREPVRVRPSRVARLLGISLPSPRIAEIFSRLGLAFTHNGNDFLVTPPSYRFDLAIEEDFIEEIARLHGYGAIPVAPAPHVHRMLPHAEGAVSAIDLKRRLVARDWQEVMTFSFVNSEWESALFPERTAEQAPIAVLNPIASQFDSMRTTLLGGLLDVLRTNLSRQQDRVRVFELGRCFLRRGSHYDQPLRIGGLAYGTVYPEQWDAPKKARDGKPVEPGWVDLFDVKSDVEALAYPQPVTTERHSHPALHPGRGARVLIGGKEAGWLGELHPRLVREFELPRAPVVFELELEFLSSRPLPVARPLSRQPVVRRDIAVVVDEAVPAHDIIAALQAENAPHVESIRVFDVYRGTGIAAGKKSLAILVLMQDTQRTLTDAEIDATVAQMLRLIAQRFGATLRR